MSQMLNRELQRTLLQRLAVSYPDAVERNELEAIAPARAYIVNMSYLAEHGLVSTLVIAGYISSARITARGLDFLADDGGLTAMLGAVSVRLHSAGPT